MTLSTGLCDGNGAGTSQFLTDAIRATSTHELGEHDLSAHSIDSDQSLDYHRGNFVCPDHDQGGSTSVRKAHNWKDRLSLLTVVLVGCLVIAVFPALIRSSTASAADIVFYDFVARAAQASWSSGAGALAFPGSEADSSGFALYRDNWKLEDDSSPTRVLETHPQWVSNGWIMGRYPQMSVPADGELTVVVGFLNGATNTDGASFQV
ncbi:MAG: hypothetical protein ACUVTR_06640 [Dehalococcoidia bacterium]